MSSSLYYDGTKSSLSPAPEFRFTGVWNLLISGTLAGCGSEGTYTDNLNNSES